MDKQAFLCFFFCPDFSGALHLSIRWINITVNESTHATPGK